MPEYLDSHFDKAMNEVYHYIHLNRTQQALTILEKLMQEQPINSELLFLKSACLLNIEKYDDALMFCNDAIREGYSHDKCFYLRAQILIAKNNLIDAEESYLESLRLDPQNPDVLSDYGSLMYKTGHERKAFSLVDEALKIDPYNSTALDFYLKYNLTKSNKQEQLEVLQKYMKSSDNDIAKLARISLYNLFSNKTKDAFDAIKQAYLLDPTNEELLDLVQEMEVDSNLYFVPINLVDKIGGPKVFWLAYVILLISLYFLKMYTVAAVFSIIYISYAVYSWTTIPVRKMLYRRVRNR